MNLSKEYNRLGFYTRESDGASGMTVTALAKLAGIAQNAITVLLNEIAQSDPITNALPELLKPFAGKELRAITNKTDGSKFIVDNVCQAVLEYYAFEARKYNGKEIAIQNYRTIARAGMRVYIWSQTGYDPNKRRTQASYLGYWAERQYAFIERTEIPSGWFCIFQELAQLMWKLEKIGYVIPDFSPADNKRIVPDVSIGRMFCAHMRQKGFDVDATAQKYPHWYPGWSAPVDANIYPNAWLEDFGRGSIPTGHQPDWLLIWERKIRKACPRSLSC